MIAKPFLQPALLFLDALGGLFEGEQFVDHWTHFPDQLAPIAAMSASEGHLRP